MGDARLVYSGSLPLHISQENSRRVALRWYTGGSGPERVVSKF